jgi:hypothetical protein
MVEACKGYGGGDIHRKRGDRILLSVFPNVEGRITDEGTSINL